MNGNSRCSKHSLIGISNFITANVNDRKSGFDISSSDIAIQTKIFFGNFSFSTKRTFFFVAPVIGGLSGHFIDSKTKVFFVVQN